MSKLGGSSIVSNASESKHETTISNFIKICSKRLKDYIIEVQNKEKMNDILHSLKLSDAEAEKFEGKYDDPITHKWMEIPVCLFETNYDLKTLLDENNRDKLGEPFVIEDITSARNLRKDFDNDIQELKANREKRKQQRTTQKKQTIFLNQENYQAPSM